MAKLTCPACEKAMGLLAFSKAPTPWHLKCRYCNAALKLSRLNVACLIASVLFGLVLGAVSFMLFQTTGIALIGMAAFLLGIIVFEWVVFTSLPTLNASLVKKS
ncbi:hypothetical protein TDB9533_03986 [Thalassocella blandensis]|nr:hypothetical protein TDB9533_03986 [Thalassocella blandensis]